MKRRLRRLRDEGGVTLIEMIMVLAILGIVLGGVTTVFISGSRAELQVNNRFQAQEASRLAMASIRKDMHSACAAAVKTGGNMQVTLAIPITDPATSPGTPNATTQCGVTGPNTAKIVYLVCTSPTNSAKYAIYRLTADPPPPRARARASSSPTTSSTRPAAPPASSRRMQRNDTTIAWGEMETIDVDIPVSVKVGQLGEAVRAEGAPRASRTRSGRRQWTRVAARRRRASRGRATPSTPRSATSRATRCTSVELRDRRFRVRSRPRDRKLPERRRRPRSAAAVDRQPGLGLHDLWSRARLVRQHPPRLLARAARALPLVQRPDSGALPRGRARDGAARRRLLPEARASPARPSSPPSSASRS